MPQKRTFWQLNSIQVTFMRIFHLKVNPFEERTLWCSQVLGIFSSLHMRCQRVNACQVCTTTSYIIPQVAVKRVLTNCNGYTLLVS